MNSGSQRPNRLRFDLPETVVEKGPSFSSSTQTSFPHDEQDESLRQAINRTRDWLIEQQSDDGYWVGELEGDTILESEYILLLASFGRGGSERAIRAANYIVDRQLATGGWSIYPGGPLEISASVKAYFALKITGHDPDAEYMQRARAAILKAGGAERVNSFTRYYLALLGAISYQQCPAVPPELMLIPRWMPFNLYEMSAWSRTIVVPLSLLWAHRPVTRLPEEAGIRELFIHSPEQLPVTMVETDVVDELKRKSWIDWRAFFRRIDLGIKFIERCRLTPFRKLAVRRAAEWMMTRFDKSDGLGAIFPPIVWSAIALKCLGYEDDSPEITSCFEELDKLTIVDGDRARLQPCKSPVWDTAISTIALREAGLPSQSSGDPAINPMAPLERSSHEGRLGFAQRRARAQRLVL